jgi:hypothetical protein
MTTLAPPAPPAAAASPEHGLLAALRLAILNDPACAASVGVRVYDEIPPEPVFPLVVLGELRSTPADSAGRSALEHGVSVHVWSRGPGREEAALLLAALRSALHDAPLTLPGRRLVLLLAGFCDLFRRDGRLLHGVLRLRAVTEPLED